MNTLAFLPIPARLGVRLVLLGWFCMGVAGWGASPTNAVRRDHWAWKAPVRPGLPPVRRAEWVRNPIDRFILEPLERAGLAPSPEASPEILFRRMTVDLTGLPPTPTETAAFLRDPSPSAYDQ